MKCQSCGKKEATIMYTENINGDVTKLHFCYECAKNLGFVDFSNIFSPILVKSKAEKEKDTCLQCGYAYDNYVASGFLGCPKCYEVFADRTDKVLLRLQGKNRHVKMENIKGAKYIYDVNATTNEEKRETKIYELKEKIKQLIKEEKYEEAAIVRDEIKKLECSK